jgi:hypothetical protein
MFLHIQKWMSRYNAYQAKRHFKQQRYALCLSYLESLEYWDAKFSSNPLYAGYLAMCHYQLKYWDNLTEEVERALFLLRRHTQNNKEAMVLWQELKSHLADLRYINHSQSLIKRASSL